MKKSFKFVLALMTLLLTIPIYSFAKSDVSIKINGETVNLISPFMENDRILVPINGVFEKLGAEVKWDKEKSEVFIEDKYTLVELFIDKNLALVHKKYDFTGIPLKAKLDVVPRVVGDTAYVPLRFAAESLGATINWDNENNSALIETKKAPNSIAYTVISQDVINGDAVLSKWYEENKAAKGIHYIKANDATYVMISAGAKNSGGYSVKVTGVISDKPDEIYVYACLENPLDDSLVTQVISYPTAFLKIDNPNIKNVGGIIY